MPKPDKRPKLVLIDGHALAYQQFFALPVDKFTTSAGEPTNATYGVARSLLDILDTAPDYLAMSFDQGVSGRDVVYPDYKGTREKMQTDMLIQMDRIRELVLAFNIPILELPDTEADDVIGTIARQAEALNVDVEILTGDRDLLQLVTDHTIVKLPARKAGQVGLQTYDAARVYEEFGVRPTQIPAYKGLVGDTSDNIPGVKGIGEKTAAILLQTYDTLENIYAHTVDQKPGVRSKLEAGRADAFLSQSLATIITNLPITLDLNRCIAHDYKRSVVAELFRVLEFRRLIDRLPPPEAEEAEPAQADPFANLPDISAMSEEDAELYSMYAPRVAPGAPNNGGAAAEPVAAAPAAVPAAVPAEAPPKPKPFTTILVNTPEKLAALVTALDGATLISFDTETTSVEAFQSSIVGISLAVNEDEGYYIPVGHVPPAPLFPAELQADDGTPEGAAPVQLPLNTVLDAIRPALTDPHKGKIAHNAAYDLIVLRRYGIDLAPITFDTMIAEAVLNPESRNKGLKNLAFVRLGFQMTQIDTLIGRGKKQITMDLVPISQVAPYAAADAVMTLRLMPILRDGLVKEGLFNLFNTLEVPLIPVLATMNMIGVRVDLPYLRKLSLEFHERLQDYEQQIYAAAGEVFNLSSPKQLNDILFGKLKLPTKNLGRKMHGFTVDAEALESLAELHPIANLLLAWRSLDKLKSTYVDALQSLADSTERIHTTYNQTGAVTGRLSSENPNLQNIPVRTEEGRRVRKAFIARPGWKLLSVDYSQIELRILAHYSGDPFMRHAFETGQDIHTATAAAVFNVPYDEVSKERRYMAKRINFGLMYGMGAFRLAKETGLRVPEASKFIAAYFERLPKIREYLDGSKKLAEAQGYLETMFGRRRNFAALRQDASDRMSSIARARAEREAINMPVQGTNADIIKQAMIDLPPKLAAAGFQAQLILQVHDELVLEVPEAEVVPVAALVQRVMVEAAPLDVPVLTEAKVGDDWADMAPVVQPGQPAHPNGAPG